MKTIYKDFGRYKYRERVLWTEMMIRQFERGGCPFCGADIVIPYRSGYGPQYVTNMVTGIHNFEYMCDQCYETWDHERGWNGIDGLLHIGGWIKYKIFRRTPPLWKFIVEELKGRSDLLDRLFEKW